MRVGNERVTQRDQAANAAAAQLLRRHCRGSTAPDARPLRVQALRGTEGLDIDEGLDRRRACHPSCARRYSLTIAALTEFTLDAVAAF